MPASKVSGHVASTLLTPGHGNGVKLIIGICIRIIFLSTVVHGQGSAGGLSFEGGTTLSQGTTKTIGKQTLTEVPTEKILQLRCNEQRDHLTSTYDHGNCSDGQVIFVTRIYSYNEECNKAIEPPEAISAGIKAACNGRPKCNDTSLLDTELCKTSKCFLVLFTCNNSAAESTPERENGGTDETAQNNKNSINMYIVTIVVVSVVAMVAIVFAVTLCLLFFCCQQSPLYRGSSTGHRSTMQPQEEYDCVDESKFQALKPSPGNNAQDQGVLCVSPTGASTTRAYHNTFNSENDDYEEISSNESLGPPETTNPSSRTGASLILDSLHVELLKSMKSQDGSPRLEDQKQSSPNVQDHFRRQAIAPAEYSSFQVSPTRHTSAASSTDQINPVHTKVSDRHVDILTVSLQQELYSRASSPSTSSASARLRASEATENYAHLVRPGERIQNTDNVYDG